MTFYSDACLKNISTLYGKNTELSTVRANDIVTTLFKRVKY